MAEPILRVSSGKARELARRLAYRERLTMTEVVVRALETYERQQTGREPAESFYARMPQEYGVDIDLEAIIKQTRSTRPKSDS